jgi:hypothetical protein
MTKPNQYQMRMLGFLLAVLLLAGALAGRLITAFDNNPGLNAFILGILAIGIWWNLRQVSLLKSEVEWIDDLRNPRSRIGNVPAPRLLAPMAGMLTSHIARKGEGEAKLTLTPSATSSMLDSLASRLDESRELSRYMTGLLIFLGLLGTFWGLLKTVSAVSDVIASMSVGGGDINAMFDQLKLGLSKPLAGMGTAFSASMFGLASALVLGFLDLTAGQAQNRFFNELEEWLAGITRVSGGGLEITSDTPIPAYVQALLEQTAENMEALQHTLTRGEESRMVANQAVVQLAERVATLSDSMRTNQQLMLRIAESHAQLGPALQRFVDRRPDGDEESRASLRSIEHLLSRMIQENETGRQQSAAEMRNDLRILTKTIAARSGTHEPGGIDGGNY